jgi:hypothetical protein
VHEQTRRVRARDEVRRLLQRSVGVHRDHEPLRRRQHIRIGGNLFQPRWIDRRRTPFVDQLHQPDPRLASKHPKVARFERLDEHRCVAPVPSMLLEHFEQAILERQADAAKVRRMLRFGINADGASQLAFELLRERDDLVERRHGEPAIVRVRPER